VSLRLNCNYRSNSEALSYRENLDIFNNVEMELVVRQGSESRFGDGVGRSENGDGLGEQVGKIGVGVSRTFLEGGGKQDSDFGSNFELRFEGEEGVGGLGRDKNVNEVLRDLKNEGQESTLDQIISSDIQKHKLTTSGLAPEKAKKTDLSPRDFRETNSHNKTLTKSFIQDKNHNLTTGGGPADHLDFSISAMSNNKRVIFPILTTPNRF
jgi:hypothetical protein